MTKSNGVRNVHPETSVIRTTEGFFVVQVSAGEDVNPRGCPDAVNKGARFVPCMCGGA